MIVSRRMSGFNFKIIVARNRVVSLNAEFEAVGTRFLGTRITDSLLPRRIHWLEPQFLAHVIVDNFVSSSLISMANASASCTVFD